MFVVIGSFYARDALSLWDELGRTTFVRLKPGRNEVCGIRDQRGGIRDQEGGIWEHNPRIASEVF